MAEKFHLDGFVMHSNRSCRAYSLGQYELAKRLSDKHGLPTLMVEGDQSDTRAWSDEQVVTRIEAFMELVRADRRESEVIPPSDSLAVLATMDELRRLWNLRYPGE